MLPLPMVVSYIIVVKSGLDLLSIIFFIEKDEIAICLEMKKMCKIFCIKQY